MTRDDELLERFVTKRDEDAFRELVERHAGMVIGTARRRTGDAELGREVAQSVFTLLARSAARLRPGADRRLAGWLHRTALLQASNALRTEMRRRHHLEAYAREAETRAATAPQPWDEALPLIDSAIDTLSSGDRDLVLMHFYQRRTFREIGSLVGASEEAVRKRASRALEKLSSFFRRRGVVMSAAALASGLSARVAEAAPSGFAASAATAAINGAASVSSGTLLANTLATTMTLTKISAAAAVVAFAAPIGLRWHETRAASSAVTAVPVIIDAPPPTAPAAAQATGAGVAGGENPVLARLAQELRKLGRADEDALRLIELQRLLLELARPDLPHALRLVEQIPKDKGALQLFHALFARWAEFNIEEALAASSQLDLEKRISARSGCLVVWVRQNPDAALDWVLGQKPGDERTQLLDLAYNQIMKSDPVGALARLPRVADEEKRMQYRRWTFEVWRASDPEAALAWLRENEPDETRDATISSVLQQMAAYRPDRAFQFALAQENPHLREESTRSALMQWAFHDPKAALEALITLPPELQTDGLADNSAVSLAAADTDGLIVAAQKLPAGRFRDKLLSQAAAALAATDPPRAFGIVAGLSDESSRQAAYEQIGYRWISHDRAAALAWLETTDLLPLAKKEKLLGVARQKP